MTCLAADKPDVHTRVRQLLAVQGPPLNRFVQGLTAGNRHLAEDLVQETMVRAWRSLDTLPADDEGARRWLFTVARRLVIDDVRRRQVRPVEVGTTAVEHAVTADDTSASAVAGQALREAVGGLSPAHRAVLDEVFFQDRTVGEAADRLGIPVGTVRSRIHYALRSVRQAVMD